MPRCEAADFPNEPRRCSALRMPAKWLWQRFPKAFASDRIRASTFAGATARKSADEDFIQWHFRSKPHKNVVEITEKIADIYMPPQSPQPFYETRRSGGL